MTAAVETLTETAALDWLQDAASKVPADQAIVELGVYRGGSLKALCDGADSGNGAIVIGVDAWGSHGAYPDRPHMLNRYTTADKTAAEQLVGDRAILIHALTTQAAATYDGPPIGLLYIDSEHKEHAVLADFHAWQPHLAPEAIIAFDDYEPGRIGAGVIAAVDQLFEDGKLALGFTVGNRLRVTYEH